MKDEDGLIRFDSIRLYIRWKMDRFETNRLLNHYEINVNITKTVTSRAVCVAAYTYTCNIHGLKDKAFEIRSGKPLACISK
jgi:desulfoferrodoxin (superoxide reductase-like protein)